MCGRERKKNRTERKRKKNRRLRDGERERKRETKRIAGGCFNLREHKQ